MSTRVRVCSVEDLEEEEVLRFDFQDRTLAIYHGPDNKFYATDGLCSHEKAHLDEGIVDEFEIECPLHFGAFDYRTGEPTVAPACIKLKTYAVTVSDGDVFVDIQ
ncbi:MAG: non-heme iron oxygenase ferredoxin subunit [Granulosicoccus sp.]